MRILIVNQAFWPDVVATAQHMTDWAVYMAQTGHEVSVIASRSVYGKQGAVLPRCETYRGVKIYRVGANLFKKGRILTRLVDFGLFHAAALWRAMRLPRQDAVVCLTTPPMIGVVGMLMKMFRRSRYVQYEMDVYPDVAIALGAMGAGSMGARMLERVHRRLLRAADRVVVLGRCMEKVIAGKGVPASKIVRVTPWADPEEIQPVPRCENAFRREHGLQDSFVVMYSGNLGLGHDIGTMIGAIAALWESADPRDRAFRFVFIGGGRRMAEVREFVESRGIASVLMLEYQPREKLSETLAAGDGHLITQGEGTLGLIVPSKFYGILAAGRPSIYIGPAETEVAMTIREKNLGVVLGAGQSAKLVEVLRQMRDGREEWAGRTEEIRGYLKETSSRERCTAKLTEILVQMRA